VLLHIGAWLGFGIILILPAADKFLGEEI